MSDENPSSVRCNVSDRLNRFASEYPDRVAIACAKTGQQRGYETISFGELHERAGRIAQGLLRAGITPGMRLAVMVPFGIDFIAIVLAMLKAGVVQILVDPGMGRKNLVDCIADSRPDGFLGIPKAQLARMLYRKRFPTARHNICVGRGFGVCGTSLAKLESAGHSDLALPDTSEDHLAAIVFTTGSTGPPKGVAYTHGTFEHQVRLIQAQYKIDTDVTDLACFPLFGLFDSVMGVTTVIPEMDPTRPADVDTRKILEAVEDWNVTQAFGSPALWRTVTQYCEQNNASMPGLQRVLSAGAPVPPETLSRIRGIIHPDADVFTPYGATESLPVATIESREILDETSSKTLQGMGTCVGQRFPDMLWRVIEIDDGTIGDIADSHEVARGDIGELMVTGPVVTKQYVTRPDQNALHKVADGDRIWHRMGDVGYLDDQDRFWFCGRKSHRVVTPSRTLYTVCCEAVFNQHPCVYRSALVGIGKRGEQHPVLIVEPLEDGRPQTDQEKEKLISELRELAAQNDHTKDIQDVRIHPSSLPVDIRHNSKIFREKLAVWVEASNSG